MSLAGLGTALEKRSLAWKNRGVSEPSGNVCLNCGACCHGSSETYVRISGKDWERLGAEAERYAQFIGNRAYLRMQDGHCCGLELRGTSQHPVYFCRLYEKRPQLCRDLERGSSQCDAEQWRKRPGLTQNSLAPSANAASFGGMERRV